MKETKRYWEESKRTFQEEFLRYLSDPENREEDYRKFRRGAKAILGREMVLTTNGFAAFVAEELVTAWEHEAVAEMPVKQ